GRRFVDDNPGRVGVECFKHAAFDESRGRDGLEGAAHNGMTGALVASEWPAGHARVSGGELLKETRPRSTEAVDGLVRIANDAKVASRGNKQLHQTILPRVDVLKFVHRDVVETVAVLSEHIRAVFEQFDGETDEVVEIQPAALAHGAVVSVKDELIFPVGERTRPACGWRRLAESIGWLRSRRLLFAADRRERHASGARSPLQFEDAFQPLCRLALGKFEFFAQ